MPEHDHAERIADKNHIHAGFIEQPCGRIVVSGQASEFLEVGLGARSLRFALQEIGHGDFSVPGIGDNAHGGLRCRSLNQMLAAAKRPTGYSPVLHLCAG